MPAIPIDEEELRARAKQAVADAVIGAELGPLEPLQGGMSSITYQAVITDATGASERVVLKVAPAGLDPVKNRDVLRQASLQRALQGTGVPAPRVLAEHAGTPPEIPPFYVMSFEEGECVEPNSLPEDARLAPEEVRARELEAARILGVLHSLDPSALGIAGEPAVTPGAELERWVQSFAASDEDLRAGNEEVRDMLLASTPPVGGSALIHGDFRLGNTLSTGMRVVSVIDWEIWAIADPRVDLAWFLMMCNPDEDLGRPTAEGMPSNDELMAAYEEARGEPVSDLEWFGSLVRYKQAAITALIVRNARRRGQSGPFEGIATLLGSARALLR